MRWRPGLGRAGPHYKSLLRSPGPLAGFQGPFCSGSGWGGRTITFKGRKGIRREEKGVERKGGDRGGWEGKVKECNAAQ